MMPLSHDFTARLAECETLSPSVIAALAVEESDPELVIQKLLQQAKITSYQADVIAGRTSDPLQLGGYLLLAEIGQGGMGRVFKARHRVMNRVVALKVIRADLLASADAVARFRREVQAAALVAHPNVVMAHDAGEAQGRHFLVMEYCEGITLSQLVRQRGPLPIGQACNYIRQAALGLQHASERGLVHRDIKPGNLMVCGDLVKILDLGLARLHEMAQPDSASILHTETGVTMGTPDFVAPEQAKDPRTADIRSDIYSLGCTLYFLLSGSVPFPGGTAFEKLLRHQMEQPKSLSSVRASVPPEIVNILERMLAKKPADRFASPGLLAEALAGWSVAPDDDADSVSPTVRSSPLGAASAIGPIPSYVGAEALASTVAAVSVDLASDAPTLSSTKDESVVVATARSTPSGAAPSTLRRPLVMGGAALTTVALLSTAVWWSINSSRKPGPDNQQPVSPVNTAKNLPGSADSLATNQLGDWPLLRHLGPHPDTVNAVAFSHDDELLAVGCGTEWADKPGEVLLWNVATGKSAGKLSGHNVDVQCLAFAPAPHANLLASGAGKLNRSVESEVRLWDIKTKQTVAIIRGFAGGVSAVAFSADGSLLATAASRENRVVRIWQVDQLLATGSAAADQASDPALLKSLTEVTEWIPSLSFSPNGETLLAGSGDSAWRWNVKDWSSLPRLALPPLSGYVQRAVWSGNGRKVAAVTSMPTHESSSPESGEAPDPMIVIWNLDQPEDAPQTFRHTSRLGNAAFLADSNLLAVGDQDGWMVLWDLAKGKQVWTRQVDRSWILALAVSHRGDALAVNSAGGGEGFVSVWKLSK